MLNLQDYAKGVFSDKKLKGAIGSDLFAIDTATKHDIESVDVSFNGNTHKVEVFKAKGNDILQVCSEYKLNRGYLGGFGQMTFLDEIAIQRAAIAKYCEINSINLRMELSAWAMTRCLVATN